MSFIKTAKIIVTPLPSSVVNDGVLSFQKTASHSKFASSLDNKINVREVLEKVSEQYKISKDPSDYIFEAARAVTAEVPNENADAFPKDELLRFDHRIGMPVYQTFRSKPHHIQHRAADPTTARGVIIDASYNDLTPALEKCPACGNKTAEVEGRDKTGVACKKCGSIVKDEFVELLIAIDAKKDPTFANGVRTGALNGLSMGCLAERTICSICDNVAHNTKQFCNHIKGGNKKKMFRTANGTKMSFEKCSGVTFTEISRVDQPADPTATQKEVMAVRAVSEVPNPLSTESDLLALSASINKTAQSTFEPPTNEAPVQDKSQEDKLESVQDQLDEISGLHPKLVKDIREVLENVPGAHTIDNYAEEKEEKDSEHTNTMAEMGIKPEDADTPFTVKSNRLIKSELEALIEYNNMGKEKTVDTKFASVYSNIGVKVTALGNMKVLTPNGTMFILRSKDVPTTKEAAQKLASNVIKDIATNGMVATVLKYNPIVSSRFAQVLESNMVDFVGGHETGDKKPVTDGGIHDVPREKPSKDTTGDHPVDHQEKVDKKTVSDKTTADAVQDHDGYDKPAKSVLDDAVSDGPERKDKGLKEFTSKDPILDRADKQAATKTAQSTCPGCGSPGMTTEGCPNCGKRNMELENPEEGSGLLTEGEFGDVNMPTLQGGDLYETRRENLNPGQQPWDTASDQRNVRTKYGASGDKCPKCGTVADKQAATDKKCMKCGQAMDAAPPAQSPMPVTAATKEFTSRLERLYANRLEKMTAAHTKRIEDMEKTAVTKAASKMERALKLAMRRQAINLENSPIKVAAFDVLTNRMDLDEKDMYTGMDPHTASVLIEEMFRRAADEEVNHLMKRASEFMGMSEDAFNAIEADVKNLNVMPVIASKTVSNDVPNTNMRTAAVNGNLPAVPKTSEDVNISGEDAISNIRSALGNSKVSREQRSMQAKIQQ